MTQENKDLLLKDLCGRLPYGVKAAFFDIEDECENFDVIEYIDVSNKECEIGIGQYCLSIDKIKPYLFPLSSMTEEQINMIPRKNQTNLRFTKTIKQGDISSITADFNLFEIQDIFDWLNKNHFDYHGLIPIGLAIDATGLNIY